MANNYSDYSFAQRANIGKQNEIRSAFQRILMCQQPVYYTGLHALKTLAETLKQTKFIRAFKKKLK